MRPLLVVLDLDGTIIDSVHKRRRNAPEPDFKARTKFVYYRPGLTEFLDLLFSNPDIRVGVWTSCKKENALSITNHLFKDKKLEFVFSRDECDLVPGPGYKSIKDLDKQIWSRSSIWRSDNTIMIDDSSDKLERQPLNLFKVSTFVAGSENNFPIGASLYLGILDLFEFLQDTFASNVNNDNHYTLGEQTLKN